jgi:hypothetical protein
MQLFGDAVAALPRGVLRGFDLPPALATQYADEATHLGPPPSEICRQSSGRESFRNPTKQSTCKNAPSGATMQEGTRNTRLSPEALIIGHF